MTNFSTVCIGKKYISSCDTNTIFLDMWALSSCNRRSWRWQQIARRLWKCSLLNVNALHKNKEKNTFDFYMENHLAPQHTFGCLSHQILAVALGFYSIYCNNFRWEGEDDFEKSKHIWKMGNMSWNQLGWGGVGGWGVEIIQQDTSKANGIWAWPSNPDSGELRKEQFLESFALVWLVFWPEKNLLVSSRNAELWICKDSAASMPSKYQTERNTQSVKFQKFDRAPSVQFDKIEKADTGNPEYP